MVCGLVCSSFCKHERQQHIVGTVAGRIMKHFSVLYIIRTAGISTVDLDTS